MAIQIDQSGKIEDTSHSTVLAASNSVKFSIVLSAKEKRRLQQKFRKIGYPRLFIDYVFAALLYILFTEVKRSQYIVDTEYTGHTKIVENLLKFILTDASIIWKQIGKGSPAHDLAYKTFSEKIKPNVTSNAEEIWKLITKKAGGRLNTGLSPANRRSAPALKKIITKKRKMSR